ncbi:MAG TPA: CHASE2 domain-containing protein [Bryobacteraceae bacterium]|nr:CHASE2 domain-containing protein [Bryobacteraceae bacterium]
MSRSRGAAPPRRFARAMWHAALNHRVPLLWGLFLVVGMQFLEYHRLLGGFEGIVLDWWVRASASNVAETVPILIVDIDEASHQACFGGRSPLPPESIRAILSELTDHIGKRQPVVMGVDILTDSATENYDTLRDLSTRREKDNVAWIVWAAPPAVSNTDVPPFWRWLWGEEEEIVVESSSVLGLDLNGNLVDKRARDPNQPAPAPQAPEKPPDAADHGMLPVPDGNLHWAMPLYPKEEDARVRRYPREIFVANSLRPDKMEYTWPRQIAYLYARHQDRFGEKVKEVIVSYNAGFLPGKNPSPAGASPRPPYSYKLNELFVCEENPGTKNVTFAPTSEMERYRGLLNGENPPIVLLGGTFELERDTYPTSRGTTPGLFINAYALAAEIAKGSNGIGIREWDRRVPLGLDFLVMLGIVWVFSFDVGIRGKIGLSVFPVLATLGLSYGAFRLHYLWVSCVGIALGFPLHLLVEVFLDAGHIHQGRAHKKSA